MRLTIPRQRLVSAAVLLALACAPFASARDDSDRFLLVRRSLDVEEITLVELTADSLTHVDADRWATVPLDDCLCLVRPEPGLARSSGGLVHLTDGQILTGRADLRGATDGQSVSWVHPVFDRIEIPLERVASVLYSRHVGAPAPGGEGDVVQLANGDRLEGFIVGLGDPVEIEVEWEGDRRVIEVPRDRVTAVRIVSPPHAPTGARIWLDEGTVLDVTSLTVHDDGWALMRAPLLGGDSQRLPLGAINAVRFHPDVFVPLSALLPSRVEGPATRFRIPDPAVLDRDAPLGLSPIRFSGPIVVHYALPAGATRFAGEAWLPRAFHRYGNCELVIRDDAREIFRATLDRATPRARVNVELTGSELTIELTEGANGPIQDTVDLRMAMVLAGE